MADQKWKGCHCICVCPSKCSYRDVFMFCAVCVCTSLRAAIDKYTLYIFPRNCIFSNFLLVFVFQPVSACG